jgi:hypothetical protein
LVVALLLLGAMFAGGDGAEAQQAGDVILASGSVTVGGSYSATVVAEEGNTLPPSGSYEVSVAFSASATLTSFDLLGGSGTFVSSGSYTAQVSATGVSAFETTGSFNVTGSFSAASYTIDGSAALATPDAGAVTFGGTGSYDLSSSMVTASGTYSGDVQTVAFGAAQVSGDYGGTGAVALNPQATTLQIALPTNLLGGIGATAAMGPVAAMALSTHASAETPSGLGTEMGTFATPSSPLPAKGVALVVWNGGTVEALAAATQLLQGASLTSYVGGKAVVLIPGAPAFVNAAFTALYPSGAPAGTLFVLVR